MGESMISTSCASTDLDTAADVLYVKLEGVRIATSREAPSDDYLILNEDNEGRVVGVQVMFASEFADSWCAHPDKEMLPAELLLALDNWTSERRLHR